MVKRGKKHRYISAVQATVLSKFRSRELNSMQHRKSKAKRRCFRKSTSPHQSDTGTDFCSLRLTKSLLCGFLARTTCRRRRRRWAFRFVRSTSVNMSLLVNNITKLLSLLFHPSPSCVINKTTTVQLSCAYVAARAYSNGNENWVL